MSRPCWDCRWKAQVELNASMTTCSRRGVGAVLVKDKRLIADGFNGNFPKAKHCIDGGCDRCSDSTVKSGEQLDRCQCSHGENSVIAYCARVGRPVEGTSMYLNLSPCLDCFKLMVFSGVKEIVYDKDYSSLERIKKLAKENDVIMRNYECLCPTGDQNDRKNFVRDLPRAREDARETYTGRPVYQRILLRLGFLRTL